MKEVRKKVDCLVMFTPTHSYDFYNNFSANQAVCAPNKAAAQ